MSDGREPRGRNGQEFAKRDVLGQWLRNSSSWGDRPILCPWVDLETIFSGALKRERIVPLQCSFISDYKVPFK